jgi:hypothetical protein
VATAKEVRRRGRLSLILGTFIAAVLLAAVAYADSVTGATEEVRDKTTGSAAWSNDVNVDVVVSMVHCPPGGDEDAVDVYMSNVSNSGPWTLVHDGVWPNGNCSGIPAPVGPATFSWTLPAGDAAAKTVYVRLTHGSDHVVVSDAIGLDTEAPTITDDGVQSGTLGGGGWYRSAVVNRFSASDGGSGLDGACAAAFPKNVSSGSAEGSNVFIPSGACSDVAGNTNGGINAGPFMIDLTAPTITDDGPVSAPDGDNGWYVSAVSNSFSASDAAGGSGLDAACAAAFPKSVSSGSAEGSAVKVSSGACSDVAGNNNPGIQSAEFMIDLTDPSVAITSPVDGFTTGASSVAVSGTASDTPSGIAGVTVNGAAASYDSDAGTFSASVALACGANTITAEATDVAGRTNSDSVSVTRTCITLTGFYSPVDPNNVAKAGQGVPFKWNAYNGAAISVADEITSTSGFVVSSMKVSCELLGSGDAVPAADDAGASGIRYDFFATPTATAQGQFVFVWKTLKDWANTCRVFKVSHSGVELTAFFRFTR